jgi:hypothetical protein
MLLIPRPVENYFVTAFGTQAVYQPSCVSCSLFLAGLLLHHSTPNHVECGVMGESGVVVLSTCCLVLLPTFVAGNCCPDYHLPIKV